ncbi:MAG: hypothetical protein ACRDRX_26355 [Pseudonocardiaceae bacterium]
MRRNRHHQADGPGMGGQWISAGEFDQPGPRIFSVLMSPSWAPWLPETIE